MHSGVGLGQGKSFGGRGSEHFRGSRTESHEEDAPNISTVLFLIVFYSSSIVWFQKLSPHPHPQRVPFKQNLRPPPPPPPTPPLGISLALFGGMVNLWTYTFSIQQRYVTWHHGSHLYEQNGKWDKWEQWKSYGNLRASSVALDRETLSLTDKISSFLPTEVATVRIYPLYPH